MRKWIHFWAFRRKNIFLFYYFHRNEKIIFIVSAWVKYIFLCMYAKVSVYVAWRGIYELKDVEKGYYDNKLHLLNGEVICFQFKFEILICLYCYVNKTSIKLDKTNLCCLFYKIFTNKYWHELSFERIFCICCCLTVLSEKFCTYFVTFDCALNFLEWEYLEVYILMEQNRRGCGHGIFWENFRFFLCLKIISEGIFGILSRCSIRTGPKKEWNSLFMLSRQIILQLSFRRLLLRPADHLNPLPPPALSI